MRPNNIYICSSELNTTAKDLFPLTMMERTPQNVGGYHYKWKLYYETLDRTAKASYEVRRRRVRCYQLERAVLPYSTDFDEDLKDSKENNANNTESNSLGKFFTSHRTTLHTYSDTKTKSNTI